MDRQVAPDWRPITGRAGYTLLVARDDLQVSSLSPAVLGRFMRTAVVWFLPAVLLLPFVLVVLAISVVAGDGSLLELGEGIRGKMLTALGPLLIACGVAAVAAAAILDADTEGWISFGTFAAVAVVVGWFATRQALRRIARTVERPGR